MLTVTEELVVFEVSNKFVSDDGFQDFAGHTGKAHGPVVAGVAEFLGTGTNRNGSGCS